MLTTIGIAIACIIMGVLLAAGIMLAVLAWLTDFFTWEGDSE